MNRLVLPTIGACLVFFVIFFLVFRLPVPPVFSMSPSVVISEVQTAGASATDEFVELYNPTGNPIDLTGWRLSRINSGGTLDNLVTTLTGTIPAFGYFLIGHPTNYTGSVTPDIRYSTSSSIASSNTVLLFSDSGTTLVDKVGFGTPTTAEGTPTTNPPPLGSIERNGTDTDNNLNDFVVKSLSDPQNSLTPSPTSSPSPTPSTEPTPTEQPTSTPTSEPTPWIVHKGRNLTCIMEYFPLWRRFLLFFRPTPTCSQEE